MNANTRNQPEKILEHFLSTGKSSDNNGDLVTRQVFVWLFLFVCCWPQILFRKETFLNRATNQPINESINQTINDQSTIQPSNQPTNQSIYQPTSQSITQINLRNAWKAPGIASLGMTIRNSWTSTHHVMLRPFPMRLRCAQGGNARK